MFIPTIKMILNVSKLHPHYTLALSRGSLRYINAFTVIATFKRGKQKHASNFQLIYLNIDTVWKRCSVTIRINLFWVTNFPILNFSKEGTYFNVDSCSTQWIFLRIYLFFSLQNRTFISACDREIYSS